MSSIKSAAKGKSQKTPRKPTKRQPQAEFIEYSLRTTSWDRYWSFGTSEGSRWEPGPYSQLGTIILRGDIAYPKNFKYPRGEVVLSARDDMLTERQAPISIGSMDARDDQLRAYLFVPTEYFAELTALATSGRIAVVNFTGSSLRYRSGTVRWVSISTEVDPDE